MADVWLPGAFRDPGRNAGYNSGRSQMVRAVAHFTVGADSRAIGRDGYFTFLVHRDAGREHGCTQYAEVDAITWHAADAGNPYGPGIEFERMVTGGVGDEGLSEAEPLTPNQLTWGERLVGFLAEHGIVPQLYDGPRYAEEHWHGWVNHQAIDSSRSDGLLRWEWDAIAGGDWMGALNDDQQRELYENVRAMASTGIPALGLKNLFEYGSMMTSSGIEVFDLPNLFHGQQIMREQLNEIAKRLDALDGGGAGRDTDDG